MTDLAALTLAWRPFLDPLNLHDWWYGLLIPLALGIAIAYKAVRVHNLRQYPKQVAVMAAQIVIAMIGLGAASYVLLILIVPRVVPMGE